MGKNSKTKLLAKARKEFVDHECQTDELEKLIVEIGSEVHDNSPTSSADLQDLTKEQLIIRLRFAQELIQRQQRILSGNEFVKQKQRKVIQDLFHTVKMLLIEHRENYAIFKRDITNALTVYANGRKELVEQLDEAKIALEEDRKQMRDSMSSNNVAVAKAKTAVKDAKNEMEKLLQEMEKMELKVDKVEKERLFIRHQYDELVNKRNQDVLTQDVLCPKCSAMKQCLNEFTDKFTKTKDEKKKFEEEMKQYKNLYEELEKKSKNMENLLKKVTYERDAYKNHFNSEKKGAKKLTMTCNSSPSIDGSISNGKSESTPKDSGKSSLNGSPVKSQETNSPIIKKVGSLEDGEVVSPEDIDGEKKLNKRPSTKPLIENIKKKPKTMDYVYIIEDEPPPVVAPLPEPKKPLIKTGWPVSKLSETHLQVPPMYSDRRPVQHSGYYPNTSRQPSPRLSDPYYKRSPTFQQLTPPGIDPYAFAQMRYQNSTNQPANNLPWHDSSRQPQSSQRHPTQNESWYAWR